MLSSVVCSVLGVEMLGIGVLVFIVIVILDKLRLICELVMIFL